MNPALLEAYGKLLDGMGDRVEAGKYLFLSGARQAEYTEPITLFLARHGTSGARSLMARFPAAVRRLPFNELPPTLQAELSVFPDAGKFSFGRMPPPAAVRPQTSRDVFAGLAATVVFLVFMVALVIGVITLVRWAFSVIGRLAT